MEAIEYCN